MIREALLYMAGIIAAAALTLLVTGIECGEPVAHVAHRAAHFGIVSFVAGIVALGIVLFVLRRRRER